MSKTNDADHIAALIVAFVNKHVEPNKRPAATADLMRLVRAVTLACGEQMEAALAAARGEPNA